TMRKVRAYRKKSLAGKALRHLLHELIDAVLMLNHHHCRQRSANIRLADHQTHRIVVDRNSFTMQCHLYLVSGKLMGAQFDSRPITHHSNTPSLHHSFYSTTSSPQCFYLSGFLQITFSSACRLSSRTTCSAFAS